MAKSFRFPRWVEKTRTYSIHPVAFIDQPVATPHQPRYAQQLPRGGSQGGFAAAGRQVGDPYNGCATPGVFCTTTPGLMCSFVTGEVWEPTDRYRLRASLSGGTAAPLCISFREAWPRLVFFTFTGYNALVTFLKGAFRCKQKKMK